MWIPNFSFKGWLHNNDNWEMYLIMNYKDIYQLYLSKPTSRDLLTLSDRWICILIIRSCCFACSETMSCTRGDRWEQVLSSTNCISLETMAKLLWYFTDTAWQHVPKTLHIWDELAAMWGLQCISLSSWPFEPKRKSLCPTKRARICSPRCFSEVWNKVAVKCTKTKQMVIY